MFLALSSFDLFLADESGVAFSLSLSTEGEITFVGGSLSVSASEVTSRYIQRAREREKERENLALRSACLSTWATLALPSSSPGLSS